MKVIGPRCYSFDYVYFPGKWSRVVLVVTSLVFVAGFPAVRSVASELTEIADVYRKQAHDLESLYVAYRISSEPLGTCSDIRTYLDTLFFENEYRVFAFKGNKRYAKMSCPNGGVYDDLLEKSPDGKPKKIRTTSDSEHAFDGKRLYYINDTTRLKRAPAAIVPNERSTDGDLYYFDQAYMYWALRMLPDSLNTDKDRDALWLPGVIEHCNCRIRPGPETVDGASCTVIEWKDKIKLYGADKKWRTEWRTHVLWCDPKLGYAARKRETLLTSTPNLLESRYAFSEFVKVANGVWLPRKGCWDRYAPEGAPSRLHNVPLIRYTYQVSDIHANDVPDNLFTLSFPPGAFVRDERYIKNGKPIFYTMPASGKDLDTVIELALKGQGLGEVLPQQQVGKRLTIGGLLLLLILLVGIEGYRIRRKFKSAS